MKLNFKLLGGGGDSFVLEVAQESSVLQIKSIVASKLYVTVKDLKLVFKGRTLADGQVLSYYKISDDAKLHVVVSKDAKRVQPSLLVDKQSQQPQQPKYHPGDFWKKLQEILSKQYDSNTVQKIMQQFRTSYDGMLKTMSLDDIERIASRNLSLS